MSLTTWFSSKREDEEHPEEDTVPQKVRVDLRVVLENTKRTIDLCVNDYSGEAPAIDVFKHFEDWFNDPEGDDRHIFEGNGFRTTVLRRAIVMYSVNIFKLK